MSDLVKLTNLLNKLALNDAELKFYHFDFLSGLNISPTNNHNEEAKTGRLFPSVDWIVPDDTTYTIEEPEKEFIKMCLIFSDLQGYDNKGAYNGRTLAEVWRDLKRISKRFILLLNRSLCELGMGGVKGEIREELDAYSSKFKTQTVKLNFEIVFSAECIDVESETVPTLGETCDLENYCFCNIIP
jgi:hypothetical protein